VLLTKYLRRKNGIFGEIPPERCRFCAAGIAFSVEVQVPVLRSRKTVPHFCIDVAAQTYSTIATIKI
jgi:hypothetical protein